MTEIDGLFLPCYVNRLNQFFGYVNMHIYIHVYVYFIGSVLLENSD